MSPLPDGTYADRRRPDSCVWLFRIGRSSAFQELALVLLIAWQWT